MILTLFRGCIKGGISRDFAHLGANNSWTIRMKIDPYCQQRNCNPLKCTFQRCIYYVDTQGVPPLAGVKQRWGGKNKLFSSKMRQYLENGRRYVQSYY